MWTFGKKIAAGFAVSFVLLLVIGAISYRSIQSLTRTSYAVTHTHEVLDRASGVLDAMKDAETGQRGFLLTGDDAYLEPHTSGVALVAKQMDELRSLTSDNAAQQRRLDEAGGFIAAKLATMREAIGARRSSGLDAAQKLTLTGDGKKHMDDLRSVMAGVEGEERKLLAQRADEVEGAASSARSTILGGTMLALVFVLVLAVWLTRTLGTQIGAAVQDVQRSSTELQSAANQQATGAKESATSMNEITTTISELLATSRQIAESAQRVAQIAEQTAAAARTGDGTVQKANDSLGAIRRQVDLIVSHMLELGKKSQHIGSVLDIVSELAEQTNILAINATIEAAGAGDAGKRFAVVADEIRKLADRVAGSTKQIRTLIDDVRSAVNTTVMTTETGSKSVDAGALQFGDVTSTFKQIAGLVTTTTQAAREIELSTKQQSTAVEQVNVAVVNVAQAARETEASSGQTLQAVSQLTIVSKGLLRLVQTERTA
jgi:methyl-accepting chemotaxis protein